MVCQHKKGQIPSLLFSPIRAKVPVRQLLNAVRLSKTYRSQKRTHVCEGLRHIKKPVIGGAIYITWDYSDSKYFTLAPTRRPPPTPPPPPRPERNYILPNKRNPDDSSKARSEATFTSYAQVPFPLQTFYAESSSSRDFRSKSFVTKFRTRNIFSITSGLNNSCAFVGRVPFPLYHARSY